MVKSSTPPATNTNTEPAPLRKGDLFVMSARNNNHEIVVSSNNPDAQTRAMQLETQDAIDLAILHAIQNGIPNAKMTGQVLMSYHNPITRQTTSAMDPIAVRTLTVSVMSTEGGGMLFHNDSIDL